MDFAPHGKYDAGKIYYPRVDDMLQSSLGLPRKYWGEKEMRLTQKRCKLRSLGSFEANDLHCIGLLQGNIACGRYWRKSDPLKVGMKAGVGEMVNV